MKTCEICKKTYDRMLVRWIRDHYWDSLEKCKDLILRHIRTFAGDIPDEKCETCDHWIPPKGADHGAVWGECPHLLGSDQDLFAIYPFSDRSHVEVHPDFGCRLWRAKGDKSNELLQRQ